VPRGFGQELVKVQYKPAEILPFWVMMLPWDLWRGLEEQSGQLRVPSEQGQLRN